MHICVPLIIIFIVFVNWLKEHWDKILTIIVSFGASYLSYSANGLSEEELSQLEKANNTALEANAVAIEAKKMANTANEISSKSLSITKKMSYLEIDQFLASKYEDIYSSDDEWIREAIKKMKRNEVIKNIEYLKTVINPFEPIGAHYCDGSIDLASIRMYFGKDLDKICDNNQLYNLGLRRNGLAILCNAIDPKSLLSKTANINNCEIKQ